MADLKALAEAVIKGDQTTAVSVTKAAAPAKGWLPSISTRLIAGMDVIGGPFKRNESISPKC